MPLDPYTIRSILGAEIVGRFEPGHGQIASLADAQKMFDLSGGNQSPAVVHKSESADVKVVRRVFLELRDARGDRGSPDLYVADPARNAAFLEACRKAGLAASDYILNKTLMNARRNKLLPGLDSVKTSIKYEDFAFAVEFAAMELDYRSGMTIDDIVCDPETATEFDSIARRIAPGHSSFEYRWAILSIRKAGRREQVKGNLPAPALDQRMRLMLDPLDDVPKARGVYLITAMDKPLYAHSTEDLRHGVELHRKESAFAAFANKLWQPESEKIVVNYAALSSKISLRAVERQIIETTKPIFNVPRAA